MDIGGQSTRPGSNRISIKEELNRVIPIIKLIIKKYPDQIISIDTYQSEIAKLACLEGAAIVNDISGGTMDFKMIETVAQLKVPYICMHIKGTPENMQTLSIYEDVTVDVLKDLAIKVEQCIKAGIKDVIIDPGFGFAKNIDQNFKMLSQLNIFKVLGKPLLAGLSRKSTIYKTLGISAAESLNGTTCLNTIALLNGADILRVHDVKEAAETIKLVVAFKKAAKN
ncbi:MAG: dihydropteroate synthase [Ferruginibacter sp.]